MKKKKTFTAGMNVGSSSILVTFVLLCLVTFAALSFVSAKADNTLTKQTGDRIYAYYNADTKAEEHLANIDSQLKMLSKNCDEKEFYNSIESCFSDNDMYSIIKEGNDTFIHYAVPISDSLDLCVTLKAVYPETSDDKAFDITEWETVTTYVPEDNTMVEEKGNLLF